MPPFLGVGLEAVFGHHQTQQHPMSSLGVGNRCVVGPRLRIEEIEGAAHIQFFCGQIDKSHVHGTSPSMARTVGDVVLPEEILLLHSRIKFLLHANVAQILGPANEVIHSLLGPIGIENLQPEAKAFEFRLNLE